MLKVFKDKVFEITETLEKKSYIDFYDYRNVVIKKYSGWRLLDSKERRDITKLIYKEYNSKNQSK